MANGDIAAEKVLPKVIEKETQSKYAVWRAEGSFDTQWTGAIRINEAGREVWLPVTVDDSNREEVDLILKKLGCNLGADIEIEMSPEQKRRTGKALEVMPPLLAINYGTSADFDEKILELYQSDEITPIIVPKAPPRSGKTLALITAWIVNQKTLALWDLDPFTGQSVSACLEKVKQGLKDRQIDLRVNIHNFLELISDIYQENLTGNNFNTEEMELGPMLDKMTRNYLTEVAGKGKLAVLADVSGYTANTKRWSPFRLLGQILPSINLAFGDNDGIPLKYYPRESLTNGGHFYLLYDQIRTNLGGNRRWANASQQGQAMNIAKADQEKWQNLFI